MPGIADCSGCGRSFWTAKVYRDHLPCAGSAVRDVNAVAVQMLQQPHTNAERLPDSGAREATVTGGLREPASGKGRFDLLPAYPLKRLAQHYEAGAAKYTARNWEKGLELGRLIDSAERHMNAFKDGDRSEDHLAAILWNICGYIWTEREIAEGRLPKELNTVPWAPSVAAEKK